MSRFLIVLLLLTSYTHAQTFEGAEQALQKKPDNIKLREQLAQKYLGISQWDKVISLMNPYTDTATVSGLLNLGTAYYQKADYQNLVRIFTLMFEKNPKDFHVAYMVGDAQLKLGATQKDPKQKKATESEGVIKFRQAIALKKDFLQAHQALVNYFLKFNMNHEATEQLNDMIRVFGKKADVLADLCRLLANEGFLSQAEKNCLLAIKADPNLPIPYVYLAQTYHDQRDLEKAEKVIVVAAKRFPQSELAQYGAGEFFLRKNNYPVALKYLQKAVQIDATTARSQISLAKALFASEQLAESLPHYSQACKIDYSLQDEVLTAASRLRQKGNVSLAAKFSQAAAGCKKIN